MKKLVLAITAILTLNATADEMRLTDDAALRLHGVLNACDADAAQGGIPQHQNCSEIQRKLLTHYGSYEDYQEARAANQ